jgi:hypothetical protein
LRVESFRGQIRVSTKITDEKDNVVAQIYDNEWNVSPSAAFDRNYNDHALEIIDAKGDVALQVNLLPDVVQIQGYWWVNLGPPNGVVRIYLKANDNDSSGGAQIVFVPRNAKDDPPKISPIFKYPSAEHPGELK